VLAGYLGNGLVQEHLKGKYHCTIDLLFDQFRNVLCAWCTKFCTAQRPISKTVKQEVNRTVILPLKVFPD